MGVKRIEDREDLGDRSSSLSWNYGGLILVTLSMMTEFTEMENKEEESWNKEEAGREFRFAHIEAEM